MSSSPRISIDAVFAYPYECILTITEWTYNVSDTQVVTHFDISGAEPGLLEVIRMF
jgi:hypothetical protein